MYNSARWRKLRAKLTAPPNDYCPPCGRTLAELKRSGLTLSVHHTPHLGHLLAHHLSPYDPTYLEVMCTSCHAREENHRRRRQRTVTAA